MTQPTVLETIAKRLLARQGIGVIWQLHLRASASHLDGNWLSAAALIGIADAAERQWAGRAGGLLSDPAVDAARPSVIGAPANQRGKEPWRKK